MRLKINKIKFSVLHKLLCACFLYISLTRKAYYLDPLARGLGVGAIPPGKTRSNTVVDAVLLSFILRCGTAYVCRCQVEERNNE